MRSFGRLWGYRRRSLGATEEDMDEAAIQRMAGLCSVTVVPARPLVVSSDSDDDFEAAPPRPAGSRPALPNNRGTGMAPPLRQTAPTGIRAVAGTPTGIASVRAAPPVVPAPNGAAHAIGERVPGTVLRALSAMATDPQADDTTVLGDEALIASVTRANMGDDAALIQHSSG
jgi:hypothetical protein